MEVVGKVHEVGSVQNVTDKFKKRDLILVVSENPEYPEYVKFEATQDRVNIFDNLKEGDAVEVAFNLRGRPFTNKGGVTTYFNSLVAWKVNKSSGGSSKITEAVDISSSANDDDDLPF